MLKSPVTLSTVRWDMLASQISGAVAGAAAEDAEQFEFAISQHADGTLPVEQIAALDIKLREDAQARILWEQDRKLTHLLKTAPLPAIRWDKLGEHLSNTIADASAPPTIKLFSNRWVRGLRGLAVAACLLLASALGINGYLAHRGGGPAPIVIGPPQVQPTLVASKPIDVQIDGLGVDQPQGQAVADITIGAGPAIAGEDAPSFADGIVATSPRSLIASNAATAQDSTLMPF